MDNLNNMQKFKNMSGFKSKNTKPEMIVRSILFQKGYRFKIHDKNLPGKPDIVLPKYNLIINIHGCYWHNHGCIKSNIPKTRTDYWLDKLENNKKRDFQNKRKLIRLGWRVVDVWECTLNKKNFAKTIDNLERMIAA